MTDTIVIKAPAGTKARWVRQSRAAGQKLTDWIVERVERGDSSMKVFKITESLASQYHGAGWALAAITDGQVVALRYIAGIHRAAEGRPVE